VQSPIQPPAAREASPGEVRQKWSRVNRMTPDLPSRHRPSLDQECRTAVVCNDDACGWPVGRDGAGRSFLRETPKNGACYFHFLTLFRKAASEKYWKPTFFDRVVWKTSPTSKRALLIHQAGNVSPA